MTHIGAYAPKIITSILGAYAPKYFCACMIAHKIVCAMHPLDNAYGLSANNNVPVDPSISRIYSSSAMNTKCSLLKQNVSVEVPHYSTHRWLQTIVTFTIFCGSKVLSCCVTCFYCYWTPFSASMAEAFIRILAMSFGLLKVTTEFVCELNHRMQFFTFKIFCCSVLVSGCKHRKVQFGYKEVRGFQGFRKGFEFRWIFGPTSEK